MKSINCTMLRKNSVFLILFALANTFNIFAQEADVTQGCAPLTVQFTNKAGVAKPYWVFKDGVTSELANPKNIFTKAGVFDVELRDGSANGAILGTKKISVYEKPTVNFKGTPLSGCTPLNIPFSADIKKDNAITISSYLWTFGDGGSSAIEKPSHTYNVGGKYSVSLSIKTNFPSCDASANFKDTVKATAAPFVIFNANPGLTSCTAPFNVTLINSSQPKNGITFAWDFGNGTKFNGEDAPAQNYTKEGNYTVSLTGTAANGCKSTYTALVSVGKPRASFKFPNDTLCLNIPYKPKNNSAFGNYQWNFGANAVFSDPTLAEPEVRWTTPGLKTVKLSVVESSGACKNDTTVTIFIEDNLSPYKTTSAGLCQSPIKVTYETLRPYASYGWYFSTQTKETSTLPKPMINWKNTDPSGYSQLGKFLAFSTVTTVSYAGCKGFFTDIDTFDLVNARVVPDKWQGCAPLTVAFADSSYSKQAFDTFTFLWGDGSAPEIQNVKATKSHTFAKAGEYKVRMIMKNKAGCIDTSHVILIEVGEPITPNFSVDKSSVCIGDTVKFKDLTNNKNVDAWHYSTDNDRSSHCFGEPNPSWAYTKNIGNQPITLTVGYNGCFSSVTKSNILTVKGLLAKLDYFVPCSPKNRNVEFKSQSQGETKLTWNFGDNATSNATNETHTYAKSGDYKVKLTAENTGTGCPASVDSVIVHVRDLNAEMEVLKKPLGIPASFELCLGEQYVLKSAKSKDVHNTCNSGYTWYFSDPNERPVTTQDTTIEFSPKTKGDYKISLVVKDINGCLDTMISPRRVFGVYPDVAFAPKEICTPNSVVFNGTKTTADTTITEWKWTFGDTPLEDKTPNSVTHKFTQPSATPGRYLIRLELKDAVGCGGSWTDTVGIYTPTSNITAKSAICLGDSLSISASDFTTKGNNLTYAWTIDGASAGTNQSFKHLFSTEGDKTIKLNYKETKTNCTGTTNVTVQVQTKPTVDFTIPTALCAPATLEFKNTTTSKYPPLSYSWDFGNSQGSNEKDGVVFYDKKGEYKVTLFAETSAGCKTSTQKTIILKEQPKGDFTMSKNVICLGESITFTLKDTAKIGSFQWFFGDGADATGQNPATHTYTSRGSNPQTITKAKLRLIPSNGGCEATAEKDITINNVYADFKILNDNVCAGTEINFENNSMGATKSTWEYGDGKSDALGKHTYTAGTSYTVKLKVENSVNGCKDETTRILTLRESPKGDFTINKVPICLGDSTVFTLKDVANDSTYFWDLGIGSSPIKDKNSVGIKYKEVSTKATLTIIGKGGCQLVVEKPINVIKVLASFNAPNVDSLCSNGNIVFQNTSTNAIISTWNFGDNTPNSDKGEHKYSKSGNYRVVLTAENNGCKSEATKLMKIVDNIDVIAQFSIEPAGEICATKEVTFKNLSLKADKIVWDFGDSKTSNEPNSVNHKFPVTESKTYTVTHTAQNSISGCFQKISKLLSVKAPDRPSAPSIFTPDGDITDNKIFTYVPLNKSNCSVEVKSLQIFDRWGRKVYESTTDFKWTGDNNNETGNPCPSDVYLYRFTFKETEFEPLGGNVTLIR